MCGLCLVSWRMPCMWPTDCVLLHSAFRGPQVDHFQPGTVWSSSPANVVVQTSCQPGGGCTLYAQDISSLCSIPSSNDQDTSYQTEGRCSNCLVNEQTIIGLQTEIRDLKARLQSTKRQMFLSRRQKNKMLKEKAALKNRLKRFLAPDQLRSMEQKTIKGTRWTEATIVKGLEMRLSSGSRGYNVVREIGAPLPAERTLQRHLEGFKLSPGILHDVLRALSAKVDSMQNHERHAFLIIDEIQITPGLAFDQTTGTVIGKPNVPLSDGSLPPDTMATHALAFMLEGVTTRWKQTVAYHFSGNSFCSASVKSIIFDIVPACEQIEIIVDGVVSDMGGGNKGLWKQFGIVVGKHSRRRVSCEHPCDPKRSFYFMADTAHLLKNLRNHLTRGQSFLLPENIVQKNQLPSNEVHLEHVKKLVELDSKLQPNIAPHLKPACLDPGHSKKIGVFVI
ncbi:uncharacterized protein LOC144104536 [Amblyomma americanum]